ncbi:MAG TPA: hypothetical protein VJN65_01095 [Bacteroidota bacterium]|nr:hypothetical protein [Bacteroidota bacterium]
MRHCRIVLLVQTILTWIALFVFPLSAQDASPGSNHPDSLQVRSLDPAFETFPDGSLADFRYLLDPPAGKRGRVQTHESGHLEFEDGTRARFWGVVIDGRDLIVPNDVIGRVLDALERAGANLIRLRELDQCDDAGGMERIDYWIVAAKQRGIYCSLALPLFQGVPPISQNTGSPGKGAHPAVLFNRKLIESQKESLIRFAVSHVNQYSGLPYANDPAVALMELGVGADLLSDPSVWKSMPEPYWIEFVTLWNDWLRNRYRTTRRLRAAWTNASGIQALSSGEDLDQRTVRLPTMDYVPFDQAILAPYHDPSSSPARRSDALRFALDVQMQYFETMMEFCRKNGIQIPLVAGVGQSWTPMTFTASLELDATSGIVDFGSGRAPNAGTLGGIAAQIAGYHWLGKPQLIREASFAWPSPYRSAGLLETAAAGLFQGVDVVTLLGYQTRGNVISLSPDGMQTDPLRWGVFGLSAKMFLSGDVAQARRTIGIRYSENDLTTFSTFESDLYNLAAHHRVVNVVEESKGTVDLTITSGRTHAGEGPGVEAILYGRSPYVESQKQQVIHARNTLYAAAGYPLPIVVFRSDSFLVRIDTSRAWVKARHGFRTKEVMARGLIPLGSDASGNYTLGFHDTVKHVIGLGGVSENTVAAFARGFLAHRFGPTQQSARNPGALESDTHELIRDRDAGHFLIQTPSFCAVSGVFPIGEAVKAGALSVESMSSIGAVVATSLDGKPIHESSRFVVKMVTVAENQGQTVDTTEGQMVVKGSGGFPVVTKGMPSSKPTRIVINGRRLLDVFMTNGTWELLVDEAAGELAIFCDTPGIRIRLFPEENHPALTMRRLLLGGSVIELEHDGRDFLYPEFSKYVVCSFK